MIGKTIKLTIILILLISVGTYGFHRSEGLTWTDSIYTTVATMTTLGNTEVPVSNTGKLLSATLVILGIGTLLVWAGTIFGTAITRRFEMVLGMVRKIKKLKNHVIICGFGNVGKNIATELRDNKIDFIIVENNEDKVKDAIALKYNALYGNALNEEILKNAEIDYADSIISTFKTDSDNVFLCLTAKTITPNIRVMVKANEQEAVRKMYKAGADLVMSPDIMVSKFLANSVINPYTSDLIWNVPLSKDIDIIRIAVTKSSKIANKKIGELRFNEKSGANILAVSRGKKMLVNPKEDTRILVHDHLIIVGSKNQLERAHKVL